MSDYSAVAPPQNFSQSSAFAAALQRAKQIAAKINPAGAQNNQDAKLKRPLEDGSVILPEPEAKKMASLVADPLIGLRGPPGSNSLGDSSSQGGRSGPTGSSSGPIGNVGGICNEDIRVPDKMVGLIIGRGGEQITRLQSETGCKIQMAPESGGLPERVCTLTGSREAVNRAKELVLSIVNQRSRTEGIGDMNMSGNNSGMMGHPGFVEIMIPGPKVGLIIGKGGETIKQLQEKSGAKMVVIQEGPSQEQEKPLRITGDPQKVEYAKQLVYELIAEKEMQMFHRGARTSDRSGSYSNDSSFNHGSGGGGGGSGGGGGGGGGTTDGVEVLVPRAAVGVVIGKGGDMIKKIQAETGARVQFQQGREDGPGDRKCILSGKHQAVEQVRQRIQELIDSVMRRDDGRGNMGARSGGPRGNGFGGNRNPNEYGGWDRRQGGPMQDKVETTFTVLSSKCGIIIGKGGETIKQINQQTGAHCELDRRNQSNENEKIFIIRGNPEQVEHAKRIFSEKLGMAPANPSFTGAQGAIGYNPTWNTGTAYQAWPNQPQTTDTSNQAPVQVNPQTGQPDYSAQWAEYYRSLGMHREADMIEQQAKQGKQDHNPPTGNPPNQPNPTTAGNSGPAPQQQQPQQPQQTGATQNGGQADYSAQWAEYYRSIGKIKEAEAIEAQMKAGKLGMQNNQMAQQQMQQSMQGQSGPPGGAPNAFPQTYGSYPTINPGSTPTGYYAAGAGSATQPQAGQQNPSFPGGYQNYPYSQTNTES
ncbi:far upstream element-binding protein 3 isoform X2 [Hylaeus anthracinus]|uniref:far upstream element-binding protein 3 isoform X2 n=1 Tax=Hylaeus anthracinus TaxID=313031 RepID=UPI0023BA08B5|nr:far upstream element-binding protein 3 isoform X2 [Hylaeus anthracinus]